jgi:hypothetical protein
MIPYIAVLILLIAVVLWQVYSQFEGFQTSDFSLAPLTMDTTLRQVLENLGKIVSKLLELKGKYTGKIFTPKLSNEEAILLGYSVETSEGVTAIVPPVTLDSLRKKIEEQLQMYELQVEGAQNDVASGAVRLDAKLVDRVLTDSTLPPDQATVQAEKMIEFMNAMNDLTVKRLKVFDDILIREVGSAPPTSPFPTTASTQTTEPTRTTRTTRTTASRETNMEKIREALGLLDLGNEDTEAKESEVTLEVTKPKDTKISSEHAKAQQSTEIFTKEIEERLAKRIATDLKNQLASKYQMQGAIDNLRPNASCAMENASAGITQGCEYSSAMPGNYAQEYAKIKTMPTANQPDMSKYVRKDSIPCWGCTLDY